ncbi:MAG TPA: hypothetical protein VFB84_21230 [Micromonosporaceae bacterium]|nr:hypothetical protein [Micromonosporaceae bacterium]
MRTATWRMTQMTRSIIPVKPLGAELVKDVAKPGGRPPPQVVRV